MDFKPTLQNDLVVLRPLKEEDFDALFTISSDSLLWEQHPSKDRATLEGFKVWYKDAMESDRAFVIEEKETGKTIGTSRYNPVKEDDHAIEIGWTFISRDFWGGKYNQATKKLMLYYAFQYFNRVLFFVDVNNFRSQKAVQKIGGKRISELNGHNLEYKPTGGAVFCIEKEEWLRAI
jgi:RimJ/RimL family protein N-acetyltransferase